jgi:hypothetical protein
MGSPPTLDPRPTRPPRIDPAPRPGASGGAAGAPADPGDWPIDQIANGFGGDLDARHRHDHTRLAYEFTHTHPELQRDAVRDANAPSTGSTPSSACPPTNAAANGQREPGVKEPAFRCPGRTGDKLCRPVGRQVRTGRDCLGR